MKEEDRVREEIAKLFKIARQEGVIRRFADGRADAKETLSIEGLRIEADDQRPPVRRQYHRNELNAYNTVTEIYLQGQHDARQDMLKDKWVKVIGGSK